jgi:predicted nucleotidyltransferase
MFFTKANTKKEIQHAILDSNDVLNRLGVKSIGLFGSFVKNTVRDDSDIDLLVDFLPGQKSFDNFMELAFFLEELLGRKVEIVTPQSLSKHIGPHILKEVENVYES